MANVALEAKQTGNRMYPDVESEGGHSQKVWEKCQSDGSMV